MRPQTNQEIAIHTHNRNLVVMAGAGSGKTYVLVNRYLSLLDSNRDWPLNALVAITFTRKAAQEMRDRVRREIELRYQNARDEAERDCWAGRITSMDSARIDTIHGLCATILRANAAEAGIDPRFEVLDEVEAERLLEDTLEDVLQAIVVERDPAVELFSHYDVWTIRKALTGLIATDLGDLPSDLVAHWEAMRRQHCVDLVDRLVQSQLLRYVLAWEPPGGWPDSNDNLIGVWGECKGLLEAFLTQSSFDDRLQILEAVNDLRTNVGSPKLWTDRGVKIALVREPIKRLQKAIAPLFNTGLTEVDDQAARLVPLWHRLITRVQVAYQITKSKDALVDFNDLERLTRDLLHRHPDVRARYQQVEFKHLLVDEFQDTNGDQWDIVRMLADPARPGSLFIVGDAKQSIYQFRGADVSVFNRAREAIQAAGGGTVPLVRSFRTHLPLVNCFNHVFGQLLTKDPDSVASDYQIALEDPMEAEREIPPDVHPAIEFLLLNVDEFDGDENAADQCRRWEAYEIGVRLRCLVEEGRLVYDKALKKNRPIGYGDMALLFRAMTDVNLYEDVLKAVGVPFVTVSGRGYYNRQEVWDLINLLTALHNPADNLRLAAALRSPLFNLSDDALLALRLCRDENDERLPLWRALHNPVGVPDDELPLVEFARDCLERLRALAGRVTISELLTEILDCTGYLATLTSLPDGARRRGNVEKLLDKARTSGQVTLGTFSQYLRDMSASEVHEGEALVDVSNAVTLMTIHGSKGLEFPLVALVDLSRKSRSDTSPAVMFTPQYGLTCKVRTADADKMTGCYAHTQAEQLHKLREEAERKRLLYVAATRAQDYLLISGQVTQVDTGDDAGDPVWKADNWLGELLGLLEPDRFTARPGETIREYDGWGRVRLFLPERPPADGMFAGSRQGAKQLWDQPAVQEIRPLSAEAREPDLLRPVRVKRSAIAQHLTATQIADLGGAEFDRRLHDKFRRSVLHDAPTPVETVSNRHQGVSGRMIGEIVHEALGWWRFPTEYDNLERVLRSYAWELGIVDEAQQQVAIRAAQEMLRQTMDSDVYRWLEDAKRVFRELPFVFRSDRRTVHGVLDVLFQRADDSWGIIDYKTSYVPGYEAGNTALLREHARRFYLQVGVYAAAAREQLGGITPDVYIHYIRYGETVRIYSGEWELALGKLEHMIGNLLDESDWVT